MIRYQYRKGPIESKVATIFVLAVIWLMVIWLMHYPDVVERWYSDGLYLVICRLLHPVFNLLPFSVGDVIYIALIIYLAFALVNIIRLAFLKRFIRLLVYVLQLVIGFQLIILSFYLLWGLNYFRPSAANRLNLQDSSYTFEDVKLVTSILIDSANASRAQLTAADLAQTDQTIYQTAIGAVDTLAARSKGFPAYHPDIKPSMLTYFLNYLGTSGYFNPFTSEAQMNYQMPVYLKSFTACHEMSHQMGFGAEDEANFGGFLAGIASRDRLLKYSTYYAGVEEFMYAIGRKDTIAFRLLKTRISPLVRQDFKTDRAYWKDFESKAGIFSGILYDHYLKTNNQPEGLKTYNQMVRLVMAWYLKNHFKKSFVNTEPKP
ncbi:DUF3810 domain-containing protein [Mucilaginibacter paludis]|uniref:Membrane protein n=1 Tax=Mucilaginibacter paludis DSM 18603 TaxID=714943 RepID=H1Y9L4_9SPHI|nr:DUF3810 domain-containing protein [Mucilaginibacter paludis]EHQ30516.1 putative membrane protein [Mucilaginibacter paludis DSM 18603]